MAALQTQLNLIVLYAADIETSKRFYEALGLTFARERHQGPEHYACQLSSMVFEIYPRRHPTSDPPAVRIGFRVASVDETIERLVRHGVPLVTAAEDSPWGRRAVVKDPDGYTVEICANQPA